MSFNCCLQRRERIQMYLVITCRSAPSLNKSVPIFANWSGEKTCAKLTAASLFWLSWPAVRRRIQPGSQARMAGLAPPSSLMFTVSARACLTPARNPSGLPPIKLKPLIRPLRKTAENATTSRGYETVGTQY